MQARSSLFTSGFGVVEKVVRAATETCGIDLTRHPLFAPRCRRATPDLQRRCAGLIHHVSRRVCDQFAAEEELLTLLRHTVELTPARVAPAPTRRLIRRAK